MKIIPFKPFMDYDEFYAPFGNMVPSARSGIIPPVDMYEKENHLIVETPLAGIDADKIEVSVQDGILTIKGSMERKTEVDEKNYYRKEVRFGSVFRQIPLPAHVEEGNATASFENGMLHIELPKKSGGEEKRTIKVDIKKGT